jgi:hypothetical protein
VSKDYVDRQDSYGRYMDRIKDEDIEEDSEEEEEEDRILNSSLSLRYTALILSKQSLIVH